MKAQYIEELQRYFVRASLQGRRPIHNNSTRVDLLNETYRLAEMFYEIHHKEAV